MAKRGEAEVIPYRKVLRKCFPRLVEDLNVDRVMDFIIQKEVIHHVRIRDIQEQVTTSKKIRMLIICLLTKNESSYQKFKDCLEDSGQSSIIEILEEEERKQNQGKSILTEKKTSVRINRLPTLQLRSSCRPDVDVDTVDSLSKGSKEWQICARLVAKNNIRRKMILDGRHCRMIEYFSVIFIDNTQEIRAVFFKNRVKKNFYKYYQDLKLKQVYYVSGAHVTDANPKYHQRAEIELKINNKTKIKRFRDALDLPHIGEHDFVEINKLKNKQVDEFVDVIGVVNYIGKIETVQTVIKDIETKREVDMVDKSGMVVSVTFWGRHARIFSLRKNSVLALLGVKVKDWKGISLSRQSSTQVNIDPDVPEAHSLREWYDSKGKKMTFTYVH